MYSSHATVKYDEWNEACSRSIIAQTVSKRTKKAKVETMQAPTGMLRFVDGIQTMNKWYSNRLKVVYFPAVHMCNGSFLLRLEMCRQRTNQAKVKICMYLNSERIRIKCSPVNWMLPCHAVNVSHDRGSCFMLQRSDSTNVIGSIAFQSRHDTDKMVLWRPICCSTDYWY